MFLWQWTAFGVIFRGEENIPLFSAAEPFKVRSKKGEKTSAFRLYISRAIKSEQVLLTNAKVVKTLQFIINLR